MNDCKMEENEPIGMKRNNNINRKKSLDSNTRLFGFPNIGHSCYMNSVLQILLHTPDFLETFKGSNNGITKHPLIDSLIEISENPKVKSFIKIKNIMAEEDESYGRQVQNDSQEFGIDLLNKIITIIKGKITFEDDFNEEEINTKINKEYKIQKFENYKNKYYKEETKLEEMFQFHEIMFNFDINDNKIPSYKTIDFNSFLNIELTFPYNGKKNSYSLSELLKNKYPKNPLSQINEEDIDNSLMEYLWNKFIEIMNIIKNYLCDNDNKDEFDNELFFSNLISLPNILIITINRAFLGKSLIKKRLIFKETLDLKDYLENDFLDREIETKYKLYGVNICHKNFFVGGHYYSYVKINDKWYKFDDNKPVENTNPELESKYVVGLYYIKKN